MCAVRLANPKRITISDKYDPTLAAGIETHADEAAVNLNVWITPTEASLAPENAGLSVYTVKPPKSWTPNDYNGPQGKAKVERLLAAHGYANVTVEFKHGDFVIAKAWAPCSNGCVGRRGFLVLARSPHARPGRMSRRLEGLVATQRRTAWAHTIGPPTTRP